MKQIRFKIAALSHNPTLIGAVLSQPLEPRPELVPCILWKGGTSQGRPIIRISGRHPTHPVKLFYDGTSRINRVCSEAMCVNPYHFVFTPRAPTKIQPPLVFEAETEIENYRTLEDAYAGIDIPRQYVLAAWRNHRQLGMRP